MQPLVREARRRGTSLEQSVPQPDDPRRQRFADIEHFSGRAVGDFSRAAPLPETSGSACPLVTSSRSFKKRQAHDRLACR